MPKKKPVVATMVSATFACPECGTQFTEANDKLSWSGSSSPCEMCGSHGDVRVHINTNRCKNCGATFDYKVVLSDW